MAEMEAAWNSSTKSREVASRWKIIDNVEMSIEKGSACSHLEEQPHKGPRKDQPWGKAPQAGCSAQLSSEEMEECCQAHLGQRRVLVQLTSLAAAASPSMSH